jgi:hypothetical protein
MPASLKIPIIAVLFLARSLVLIRTPGVLPRVPAAPRPTTKTRRQRLEPRRPETHQARMHVQRNWYLLLTYCAFWRHDCTPASEGTQTESAEAVCPLPTALFVDKNTPLVSNRLLVTQAVLTTPHRRPHGLLMRGRGRLSARATHRFRTRLPFSASCSDAAKRRRAGAARSPAPSTRGGGGCRG